MTRPRPGELYWRSPDCPLCDNETQSDGDSFRCYQCRCSWSYRGGDGEWDEPDEPICPKFLAHHKHPILSGRCLLGEGHEGGEHNNGNTSWRSDLLAHRPDVTESEIDE